MTTRDDRPSDRRLSAVWLAAGVLSFCGLGSPSATSAMIVAGDGQASTPPRTYRVLTYNVQFRPPALNYNSAYNMLNEKLRGRAHRQRHPGRRLRHRGLERGVPRGCPRRAAKSARPALPGGVRQNPVR